MEPILAKADNYSFLKKLVENVKETKDAQAPDDEEVNKVKQEEVIILCQISWTRWFDQHRGPTWSMVPPSLGAFHLSELASRSFSASSPLVPGEFWRDVSR